MPSDQIPEEAAFSPDSSLASSNENVSSTRSTSSNDDGLICPDPYPQQIFNRHSSIRLAQMAPQRYQYEPKLDDLLRQVSGSNNLETLADIQMRVMTSMVGLHRLNVFLPCLMSLNLDGSALNSLRDLGCGLTIKYLNVSRCGLRSLDGISGLAMVEHLVADCNHISNVGQLNELVDLKKLSLRGNCIEKCSAVSFLSFCPALRDVDLTENPISRTSNYRARVKEMVPELLILDGRGFTEESTQNDSTAAPVSSSEFSSSLTSSSKADSSHTSNELRPNSGPDTNTQRASSSCEMTHSARIDAKARPSTADSYQRTNSLTVGAPICGNIVGKVRRERRQKAWTNSRSSSSSMNSGEGSSAPPKSFPLVLPQETIELELGVIATTSTAGKPSTADKGVYDSAEVDKMLSAAMKWRIRSRANRTVTQSESFSNSS